MPLHATTLAMYENKDGVNLISTSRVSSHGLDNVRLEESETVEVGYSEESVRGTLLKVLREIAAFRVQYVDISSDTSVVMPHSVVFGFKELHNSACYQALFQNAFPEYFPSQKQFTSTDACLSSLLDKFLAKNTYKKDASGNMPTILRHPFALFLPEDNGNLYAPDEGEKSFSQEIDNLIQLAENGTDDEKEEAGKELVAQAERDAQKYAIDLRKRGILDPTRFVQFGPHTEAFKNCSRYTYLAHGNLRDIFVWELIQEFKEPHNVCVKTPADTPMDKPSPAFVDIAATFLQDAEMWLLHERSGQIAQFRNVFARR